MLLRKSLLVYMASSLAGSPMRLLSVFLFSLILTSCGCPHKYVPGEPEPLPGFYMEENIRVALVLGSGGVRGMAHVGVLEELEKACIPIDLIVGCSAGSIVGALYADNPQVEAIKLAVWQLRRESLIDIDFWNCRYGMSQGRNMREVLDTNLTARTFEELKIPLVVVASDLNSGELVAIGSGDLIKGVQASCAMPFVFVPCEHLGRILVDGGVINPVPVKVAKDLGADIVIAVDLCELLPHTFPENLFQVATRSAEIAFMWQNEVCTRQADVIIRPRTRGVGSFNDKMKWEIYEEGKRAAHAVIPYIQDLIASRSWSKHQRESSLRRIHLNPYIPGIQSR
jgi:NTE family protein